MFGNSVQEPGDFEPDIVFQVVPFPGRFLLHPFVFMVQVGIVLIPVSRKHSIFLPLWPILPQINPRSVPVCLDLPVICIDWNRRVMLILNLSSWETKWQFRDTFFFWNEFSNNSFLAEWPKDADPNFFATNVVNDFDKLIIPILAPTGLPVGVIPCGCPSGLFLFEAGMPWRGQYSALVTDYSSMFEAL